MALNINNEHNSSCHVNFNTPMPTHNSRQPKTNCSMRAGRHVIENAVERSSWGKSGCEWMCRFPDTGGLHRTSGNAPLETGVFAGRSTGEDAVGHNTHPPWCHVYKTCQIDWLQQHGLEWGYNDPSFCQQHNECYQNYVQSHPAFSLRRPWTTS
jgi:hypothetical protein